MTNRRLTYLLIVGVFVVWFGSFAIAHWLFVR